MTEFELLRARLVALRRSALDRLAETDRLDGGMLRLVADAGAALAALDEEAAAALAPERDGRAVVLDDIATRRSRLQYQQRSAKRGRDAQPGCCPPARRAIARRRSSATVTGSAEK